MQQTINHLYCRLFHPSTDSSPTPDNRALSPIVSLTIPFSPFTITFVPSNVTDTYSPSLSKINPPLVPTSHWKFRRETVPSNVTAKDSPFTLTLTGAIASDTTSPPDAAEDGSASLSASLFAITLPFSKVTVVFSSMTTIAPSSDTTTTFPFTMAVYASKITCTASLFTSPDNGFVIDDAIDLYTVSITYAS